VITGRPDRYVLGEGWALVAQGADPSFSFCPGCSRAPGEVVGIPEDPYRASFASGWEVAARQALPSAALIATGGIEAVAVLVTAI
jgi:hypothetical protein